MTSQSPLILQGSVADSYVEEQALRDWWCQIQKSTDRCHEFHEYTT